MQAVSQSSGLLCLSAGVQADQAFSDKGPMLIRCFMQRHLTLVHINYQGQRIMPYLLAQLSGLLKPGQLNVASTVTT